jgi:hypothetical protein
MSRMEQEERARAAQRAGTGASLREQLAANEAEEAAARAQWEKMTRAAPAGTPLSADDISFIHEATQRAHQAERELEEARRAAEAEFSRDKLLEAARAAQRVAASASSAHAFGDLAEPARTAAVPSVRVRRRAAATESETVAAAGQKRPRAEEESGEGGGEEKGEEGGVEGLVATAPAASSQPLSLPLVGYGSDEEEDEEGGDEAAKEREAKKGKRDE